MMMVRPLPLPDPVKGMNVWLREVCMDGETGKSRPTIAKLARRLIAWLRRELGQLATCSYPADPAVIGITLNRDGDLWRDRLGRNTVAGRSSQASHGSDISTGNAHLP